MPVSKTPLVQPVKHETMARFLETVRILPRTASGEPLSSWDTEYWSRRRFPAALEQASPEELGPALSALVHNHKMAHALLDRGAPVSPEAIHRCLIARFESRVVRTVTTLQEALDLMARLLCQGGDPNGLFDYLGIGAMTPLERSVSGSMPEHEATRWVETLLRHGADPNLKGHPKYGPPLVLALRLDTPEATAALLAAGAKPERVRPRWRAAANAAQQSTLRAWRLEQELPPAGLCEKPRRM